MPAGRPTTYTADYCDKVQEYGARGKSITWMAAELGVAKDSIYAWEKEHPEFSAALTRARALSQKWWEDFGQDHMLMRPGEGNFSASAWSRSMAARFPDDWREASKTEITGKDGAPLVADTAGILEQVKTIAFALALGGEQVKKDEQT